jgi:hypothetical protein
MSPSSPHTARGPRRWLIAALILAGCLAAAPGWCSPTLGGDHLPGVAAAPAGAALSALVDPAWRWLRQLWLGLPWPISGGGVRALPSGRKATPAGRHGHGIAASPASGSCGDDDDDGGDPVHGGDPDG